MSVDSAARHDHPTEEANVGLGIEELAKSQGVRPIHSPDELWAELWDSDDELDAFLTEVRRSRQVDLA